MTIIPAHDPAVTLVTTRSRSADDLTDTDYRDIYDELRSKCPLRQFADLIHSQVSFAWWSKYERGDAALTRARRAELRAAVGLPVLPPAVADVLATVDPDATIYQIGAGAADRVVMLAGVESVTMRLNGALQILDNDPVQVCHVTAVTAPSRQRSTKSLSVRRETWERLNNARLRAGLTWDEFLAQLE